MQNKYMAYSRADIKYFKWSSLSLTLERQMGGGGLNELPICFFNLKFEAFKQSKQNFKYL